MTTEVHRGNHPPSPPDREYPWLHAAVPPGRGEAVVIARDPAIAEAVVAAGWQPRLVDPQALGDPAAVRSRWRLPVGLVVVDSALSGYHHADKRAWAGIFARQLRREGAILVLREPIPQPPGGLRALGLRRALQHPRRHRGPANGEFWTQAVRDAGLTSIEVTQDDGYLVLTARH